MKHNDGHGGAPIIISRAGQAMLHRDFVQFVSKPRGTYNLDTDQSLASPWQALIIR